MANKIDKLEAALKYVTSPKGLNEVGEKLSDLIKSRIKSGKGVKRHGAKERKLKKLSDSYKKERTRLQRQGKLSSDTSPGKSNFHKSGDTVNAITHGSNNGNIVIKTDPAHTSKIEHQDKAGRTIMNVSNKEIEFITKTVGDIIKQRLKG